MWNAVAALPAHIVSSILSCLFYRVARLVCETQKVGCQQALPTCLIENNQAMCPFRHVNT